MPASKPAAPVLQANQYATGLVYFGVMYEGSGTTLHDLSSNADNGTVVGTTWGTGQFSGPDINIAGTAANEVLLSSVTPYQLTGDFSVSCWVKLTNPATSQCFVSIMADVAGNLSSWAVGCDDAGTGKVKWFTANNSASGTTTLSAGTLSSGVWHHVCAVWTSATTTVQIYIDGALDTTGAAQQEPGYPAAGAGTPGATVGGLYLAGTPIQPTVGEIDAVAVYNYALPASGGTKDSVSGIFADPFRAVRAPAPGGIKWGAMDVEEAYGIIGA